MNLNRRIWWMMAILVVAGVPAGQALAQCAITSHPPNRTVCEGSVTSMTVTATHVQTYQWRRNGVEITDGGPYSGTTTRWLTITAGVEQQGVYDCIVQTTCGPLTSNVATLTVSHGPMFTVQPISAARPASSTEVIRVATTSPTSSARTYQWRRNGVDLEDGHRPGGAFMTGAQSAALRVTGLTASDAGLYDVVATDQCGSTLSAPAELSVNCGARWMQAVRPGLTGPAAAFDTRRGRVILFGGQSDESGRPVTGNTWEYDGHTWSIRATGGPIPRVGAAMAYDSRRGRAIMHGGWPGAGPKLDDTWEWDGSRWELRATEGPGPRIYHAMAYDARRGRTLLYGDSRTTWEWDGETWTAVATTGPPTMYGPAMAYDSARERVVLFGGTDNATWEWNGTSWTQAHAGGTSTFIPEHRRWHSMAYDEARQRVVMFGGNSLGASYRDDTWEWDGNAWRAQHAPGPIGRYHHAIVYDSERQRTVLVGGERSATALPDTWEWDGTAWWDTPGESLPRESGAMVYDSGRDRLVTFGGGPIPSQGSPPQPARGLWEWDGNRWGSAVAPSHPQSRTGTAMAYDSARERTVIFGGARWGQNHNVIWHNDTLEWDGTSWQSHSAIVPAVRASHAMAYDSGRGRVVLFGGHNETAQYGDTWEWAGGGWNLRTTWGPQPRSQHAMAFDSARQRTVLFGGRGGGNTFDDTWEWDGVAWVHRTVPGPGPRYNHAMAFDSQRGRIVLWGGQSGSVPTIEETWEWDGQAWHLAATDGPPARNGHMMAFDGTSTIMLGGQTPGDQWAWDGVQWSLMSSRAAAELGPIAHHSATARTISVQGDLYSVWNGEGWDVHQALGDAPTVARGILVDVASRGRLVYFRSNHATWEFDGAAWEAIPSAGPTGRQDTALAYDAARQRVVLYSGRDAPADTWEWDGATWQERITANSPGPRRAHSMAYDPVRERIVLFGGGVSASRYETWEWDGNDWELRSTTGPAPRLGAGMVFDPVHQRILLISGRGQTTASTRVHGDTWAWDGHEWTLLSDGAVHHGGNFGAGHVPPSSSAAYDPVHGQILLGGLWVMAEPAVSITRQPQSMTACWGDDVRFSVEVNGPDIRYQWQHNGQALPGETSPVLVLHRPGEEAAGVYTCIVTAGCANEVTEPAILSICYANCDCSTLPPILTVNDFLCFVDGFSYAMGLPLEEQIEHYANCDGRTTAPVLTVNDFLCFIDAFSAGCP